MAKVYAIVKKMTNPLQPYDFQLVAIAGHITNCSLQARVLVYGVAELLIFLFPLVLYILWKMPEIKTKISAARKAVILALMSTIVSIAIKSFVSVIYLRPRPFVSHPELAYFHLGLDPQSFPSGHTMVAFAIAFSLYFSNFRKLGGWLLVLAVAIGISRVFAGVHYPSDVLAGALIGSGTAWYLHREASDLQRYLPNE